MLLYCAHTSPRLRYVAGFISRELLALPIRITTDKEAFVAHYGPRINYSAENIPDTFAITPAPLLFETGIGPQDISCFDHNGRKAFFATQGNLPFDIFAAAFYLITRYEEYLPHEKDPYGRYAHTNSLAWKEGFLDIPLTLRNPAGLAALACIITSTPGTAWAGYDATSGVLTMHVLDLVDAEAMRDTIRERYERRLMEIFR